MKLVEIAQIISSSTAKLRQLPLSGKTLISLGQGICWEESWLKLTFSMTTSKADMRSLATKSSLSSSTSKKLRTLPEAIFSSLPCKSIVTIAGGVGPFGLEDEIADISVVGVGRVSMHTVDQSSWVVRGGRLKRSILCTSGFIREGQQRIK